MMGDDNFSRWPNWAQTHLVAFAPDPADETDDEPGIEFVPSGPHEERAPGPRRSRRAVLLAAGAVVVVAALAVTFVVRLVMSVGGDDSSIQAVADIPAPAAADPSPSAASGPAAGFCPASDTPELWVGNGAGGTDSARAAIAGFEHAYYAERSGQKARTFTTPDAAVPPADQIQQGIDNTISPQTDYCLRIRPAAAPNTHTITLTVRDETGQTGSFDQVITTTRAGDRVLITAITAAE
ncbi:hypothetical protein [Tomitella gaofuii]|uniref:hypothetical protein n=1 Tax=Tomitella gaofuii TaxID=2760083 RepID=UPI0015F8CF32|nr:hypothetical protein [Tomitella gaofuii]